VSYELTNDDFVDFQRGHARRTSGGAVWLFRIVGALLLLLSAWSLVGSAPSTSLGTLVPGVVFLLLGSWLGSRAQFRRALKKAAADGRRYVDTGTWKVATSRKGVAYETPLMDCRLRWTALERIVEQPELLAIYTSPITAIIVPKRAFDGPEHAAAFRSAVDAAIREDRSSRGLAPTVKETSTTLRALLPLIVWVLLILVFLGVWTMLSPDRPPTRRPPRPEQIR
jgi:hypothetical protein